LVIMIEIENLSKRYGARLAVNRLNLKIEEGELFGFVGPNGAGKTSTIRMMTGLLQPTAGDVKIAGQSVRENPNAIRRAIGYMPDFFGVYNDMTVAEYLDFFGACYQIPANERSSLISDLLELVELSHRQDDMVDKLSRGMKQRLSLARTLVHDPQVLILDEPASGLDPRARVEIRALLVELANMGKTIFFSTHILADVAEICSRVAILEAGELVAVGALEELQQQLLPRRKVEITLLGKLDEARQLLLSLPGVASVELPNGANGSRNPAAGTRLRLVVEFAGDDVAMSSVLASLVEAQIPVINFSADSRDLEEVFMKATKGLVT
jgi:ABC-2 type transport system ATP-binding protein